MSSTYGKNIRITIFGQSHSPAIGMTMEGIPAGGRIDMERLQQFLNRRAPGRNDYSTPRKEEDRPEFVSGLVGDVTCGVPITALIYNHNTRSSDYDAFRNTPRPGHADFTAQIKYRGHQDHAGGGHFSGRLTAPLCIAGGICQQLLEKEGIRVFARIQSIAHVKDDAAFTSPVGDKDFPVVTDEIGRTMKNTIGRAKRELDSVGGIIECIVDGLPAGLGDPMFDGMESRIAAVAFGIPAVKGIEFGVGFEAAKMYGSQNNDPFEIRDGEIVTETNHCGGILGGITNGMPIVFRVAIKPTPSIAKEQKSVDMKTGQPANLSISGRHDPCIVPRAVPCIEAAAAIAVYDALLESRLCADLSSSK